MRRCTEMAVKGLTDVKVRNMKPKRTRYKVADTNGLYIEVHPSGSKHWLVRLTSDEGKRTWKSIGKYPIFTINDARAEVIKILRGEEGFVPKEEKIVTFRRVAEEFVPELESTCATARAVKDMYRHLDRYVYPLIGDKDISALSVKDIFEIIDRMNKLDIRPTAVRVVQLCSRIFRFAMLKEYCVSDPCYALRGQVKMPPRTHRASIVDPDQVGQLMRSISAIDRPFVRILLLFSAYSFCRPGEVRGAAWSEIDLEKSAWIVPAERMKMKREHMVPLTKQLMGLLDELRPLSGHKTYLFPSVRYADIDQPMASSTAVYALRSLGYTKEQMSAHGFRSMASTILNENNFNYDWIEMQLAHSPRDQVRGAYIHQH